MSEGRNTISTSVRLCLSLLKTVQSSVNAGAVDAIGVAGGISSSLDEQKSRFTLWAANIGAHKSRTSSLEYMLRDASNIRRNVLNHLIIFGSCWKMEFQSSEAISHPGASYHPIKKKMLAQQMKACPQLKLNKLCWTSRTLSTDVLLPNRGMSRNIHGSVSL